MFFWKIHLTIDLSVLVHILGFVIPTGTPLDLDLNLLPIIMLGLGLKGHFTIGFYFRGRLRGSPPHEIEKKKMGLTPPPKFSNSGVPVWIFLRF